jgi:hypothetical protein
VLPVHSPDSIDTTPATDLRDQSAGHPRVTRRTALDRSRSELADLASAAEERAAVDQRAAELDRRVTELPPLATSR